MSVGAWRPLWLGDAPRQLYAAVHPAPNARVGVVMAPPLLHEQPRSRRVLVEIASRFAELGVACLRFDYFGTGDSAGRGEQHEFAAVHADLDAAANALREDCGVAHVALLAWRGAALPAWSWVGARKAVAALALWEPVADGAAWLAELAATDSAERLNRYGVVQDDPRDTHLMGFPTSSAWRTDVAGARLGPSLFPHAAVWTIERAGAGAAVESQRRFELPSDAPRLDDGTGIETNVFLSRKLFGVVDELGHAFAALGG